MYKLVELMVNKELKPYGKTMKDVLKVKNWYTKYKFKTYKDYTKWVDYCKKLLKTKVSPRLNKVQVSYHMSWLALDIGLSLSKKAEKERIKSMKHE